MWLLKWLPDWFFYVLFLAGLFVSLSSKLLPLQYKLIAQVASALAIFFAIFMIGGIHEKKAWEARVAELEKKIAQFEVDSTKTNVEIKEKVVTKTQIVKQKGEDVIHYIDREVVKYDNTCPIPKEFVKAHNDAAKGVK